MWFNSHFTAIKHQAGQEKLFDFPYLNDKHFLKQYTDLQFLIQICKYIMHVL